MEILASKADPKFEILLAYHIVDLASAEGQLLASRIHRQRCLENHLIVEFEEEQLVATSVPVPLTFDGSTKKTAVSIGGDIQEQDVSSMVSGAMTTIQNEAKQTEFVLRMVDGELREEAAFHRNAVAVCLLESIRQKLKSVIFESDNPAASRLVCARIMSVSLNPHPISATDKQAPVEL